MFRIKIPEFSRTLQAKEFIDWINDVERIFEYKDVPEQT